VNGIVTARVSSKLKNEIKLERTGAGKTVPSSSPGAPSPARSISGIDHHVPSGDHLLQIGTAHRRSVATPRHPNLLRDDGRSVMAIRYPPLSELSGFGNGVPPSRVNKVRRISIWITPIPAPHSLHRSSTLPPSTLAVVQPQQSTPAVL
jgi:hypothetical protein